MKKLLILLTLFVSFTALAQDQSRQKDAIIRLANQIIDEVYVSNSSRSDLSEVHGQLQGALDILVTGSRGDIYQKCVDYAYKKFYRSLNSSEALKQAQRSCRSVADIEVLKFLYEKHFRNLPAVNSIRLATRQAKQGTHGKIELLKFAYKKHFRNFSSSQSATKASSNILFSSRRLGMDCYKKYFPIHFRSLQASAAMDETAKSCYR